MNESYIGGVPSRVFAAEGFMGDVTGRSGRRLSCEVREGRIDIEDTTKKYEDYPNRYHFSSNIDGDNNNQINFNIKTDKPIKAGPLTFHRRHPDLYAAQLMKASLQLFEQQGYTLTRLKATWSPQGSVNYDEYMSYLRRHSRGGVSTMQQRLEAARHTWTGEQARRLGFTRISGDVDSSGYYTIVTFER